MTLLDEFIIGDPIYLGLTTINLSNGSGVKISDLPAISLPLSGTEIVVIVQGGITKRGTLSQIRDYLSSTP